MTEVVKFIPKPLTNEQFMDRFRAECALTGDPVSSDKCESGDPGTITTADGDILNVGGPCENTDHRNPDYAPCLLWDNCQHEWKVAVDSMTENEVHCIKCGVPGERDQDGAVYWPTT